MQLDASPTSIPATDIFILKSFLRGQQWMRDGNMKGVRLFIKLEEFNYYCKCIDKYYQRAMRWVSRCSSK